MRACTGLPAVRMFRWHILYRYNNEVIPLKRLCRSSNFLMEYNISNALDTWSSYNTQLFRNFSHSSEHFTISSSDNIDSSESLAYCDIDYSKVFCEPLPVPLIEEMYSELITSPKWLTNSEWSAFGEKFNKATCLPQLWPTLLLNCITHKTETVPGLYDIGMSLVDYVASLSERHRLLRLVSAVAVRIHQGGEKHCEKALALYDELCAEYEVLDYASAHVLIVALAKTRYWRRCLELIDMMKITGIAGASDYSAVIVASMVNQDYDLANELLETLSRNGYTPHDNVFMHMCTNGIAEQVLTVLKNFGWIPSGPVIDCLISQLERYVDNC